MNKNHWLAIFAMVFTAMVWGITFEMVQDALNDSDPFIFAAFRFGIGFMCGLLYYIFNTKQSLSSDFTNNGLSNFELKGGLLCGILLCMGYAFQNFGLWDNSFYIKSTPSNSAFITSISVIFIPIFLYLFNLQKVNYKIWLVIIVTILGLFILLNPREGVVGGDIVTFGCAISFAIHIILQDIYLRKGANVLRFFMIQILFVSLFSLVLSFVFQENIVFSNEVILALVITGVLATFVGFILMLWAQTILSATETGILLSLEPLFATLYSVFFAHKLLGLNGWIGGFIIIIAVMSSSFISYDSSKND